MKGKKEFKAEIQKKLTEFDNQIQQIETLAKQKGVSPSKAIGSVEALKELKDQLELKLKQAESHDEQSWSKLQAELENYVADIGEKLRQGMIYFNH